MKTNLIRIALAAAAVTALGLTACSSGAQSKPTRKEENTSEHQAPE